MTAQAQLVRWVNRSNTPRERREECQRQTTGEGELIRRPRARATHTAGPAPPCTPQRSPGATHTVITLSNTPRKDRWAFRRDTTGELRVYAYAVTVPERCRRHGPAPPHTPQRSPGATHAVIALSNSSQADRWACRRDTTGEGVLVRRPRAVPQTRTSTSAHAPTIPWRDSRGHRTL